MPPKAGNGVILKCSLIVGSSGRVDQRSSVRRVANVARGVPPARRKPGTGTYLDKSFWLQEPREWDDGVGGEQIQR